MARKNFAEEIGSISRSLFNRLSDTEYLSLLTWPNSITTYDKMRRSDAQVQALLYCLELPIRSTRWYVEPYNKNNPKDVQIAEFIEENLFSGPPKGMTVHWDDFLRLALLMFSFGHSVFEKVYEVDSKGFAKWRKFAERPHETIKDFKYDEKGGPLHVEQYVAGASFVEMPVDNCLIFTHRKEGGRLHGIPVLRAAYKHWFIKDFLLKITNIGIEKNHVGTPAIKLPETPQEGDKEEAQKITSNLRSGQDAGVVLPHGFTLEMFEGKRVAIEVLPYIQYQDQMIAKAALAQFLQLGTGSVGSFALGKDQSDFFLMSLNSQAKYVCDTVNSYAIPQLVDYNWDVEGYPKLRFEKVGGRNTSGIIEGVKSLVEGRIILPDDGLEKYMRELMELPEIDEETIRGGQQEAFIPPKPPKEPVKASELIRFSENSADDFKKVKALIKSLSAKEKDSIGPRWFFDDSQYRYFYEQDSSIGGCIECRLIGKRAYLNLIVHTDFRGQGLANKLTQKAIKQIPEKFPEIKKFYWSTHSDNEASIHIAEKYGFEKHTEEGNEVQYTLELSECCSCGGTKKFAEPVWRRDLTAYEKRIKLSEIDQKFDTSEEEFVKKGMEILGEQFAPYLTQLAALITAGKWEEVSQLVVESEPLAQFINDYLAGLFAFGTEQAAGELETEKPGVPDLSKQIIGLRAATITEKIISAMSAKVVFDVLNSVEAGEKPKDAVNAAKQNIEDYMKKELEGHATVQTAWAINSGRDFVAEEQGVKRIQYSAILDKRTCPLCKKLDGMIFKAGTPEAKRFKPPVHHNCRCIFAYVMPEEQPQPEITFEPPPDELLQKHGNLIAK